MSRLIIASQRNNFLPFRLKAFINYVFTFPLHYQKVRHEHLQKFTFELHICKNKFKLITINSYFLRHRKHFQRFAA